MPEGNKPFVVTDRRKFTMDGEVRPDADRPAEVERPVAAEPVKEMQPMTPEVVEAPLGVSMDEADATGEPDSEMAEQGDLPPAPTTEQMTRARMAYEQTTERLDTAIRAANPGGEHPRTMDFVQMVQSFYMTAILQLGGATQEGQQPQVDLMGARQSIDMLVVLGEKAAGGLSGDERRLLDSAVFDAQMAFLEITQAIARQAQASKSGPGGFGGAGGFGGPSGFGGPGAPGGGGMGLVR